MNAIATTNKVGNRIIKITFPFSWDTVEKVKTLPKRKYNPDGKYWVCPLKQSNVQDLDDWGFALDAELQKYTKKPIIDKINVPIKKPLYEFQKEGVGFIESKNGRCILGDEMGLGKTIQALAWLEYHPEARPVIVVCPASVKYNWEKEILECTSSKSITVLEGTGLYNIVPTDYIIINYDIIQYWHHILYGLKPKAIVLDEIHYIKNSKAKRTKAIRRLAPKIPYIIGLTGTLIINRPIELFNPVNIIDSSILPPFWEYVFEYCNAYHHTKYGWNFNGAKNTQKLNKLLTKTIMIRHNKSDVLKDLPDKIISTIPLQIKNIAEYNQAKVDLVEWLRQNKPEKGKKKIEAFAKIEYLKQITLASKMDSVVSWIQDYLVIEDKLVVFATHKSAIARIMAEFGGIAVKIDGSTPQKERPNIVNKFQTNPNVKLFVGNIEAAGTGITLTAASSVAFVELGWSPGEHAQAEDRIHRIGQTATAINVYYLLARNTIEEDIAKLLDWKKKVTNKVLDGKETEETNLLNSLIKELI